MSSAGSSNGKFNLHIGETAKTKKNRSVESVVIVMEHEGDYEYTRFRLAGRKLSRRACSEFCPCTRSRPHTPICGSLLPNSEQRPER